MNRVQWIINDFENSIKKGHIFTYDEFDELCALVNFCRLPTEENEKLYLRKRLKREQKNYERQGRPIPENLVRFLEKESTE